MDKLIKALEKSYGLKVIKAERIEYRLWEESFAVWTETERWYAKRFWKKSRVEKRYDEMVEGVILSQNLRAKGFPAPKLLYTIDRKPFAHVDNECYQVNEWVYGNTYHPGELTIEGAYSMGNLLGRFHSLVADKKTVKEIKLPSPSTGLEDCKSMLMMYKSYKGDFADMAKSVLMEQIAILESLPQNFLENNKFIGTEAPVYNSFWIEQLMFKDNWEVAALIDWTDGAGRKGLWIDDIEIGAHLSALGTNEIVTYCKGYQVANPLSVEEWKTALAKLCYGHVAQINFLSSWIYRTNRRMEHWEKIAITWHTEVPKRFHMWQELQERVLEFI